MSDEKKERCVRIVMTEIVTYDLYVYSDKDAAELKRMSEELELSEFLDTHKPGWLEKGEVTEREWELFEDIDITDLSKPPVPGGAL